MDKLDLTCSFVYQPKFVWESGIWGSVPRWLSPPDIAVIETLARRHLQLPVDCRLDVRFFSEGAFNKLYTVAISGDSGNPQYIFRTTTPVNPSTRPQARWRRCLTYENIQPFRYHALSPAALLPKLSSAVSGYSWKGSQASL